jgi:hypothetical protein
LAETCQGWISIFIRPHLFYGLNPLLPFFLTFIESLKKF